MELAALEKALPDHAVRPVTMDDVPALTDLVARLTTVVLGEPDVTEAEIRDDLNGTHFDLEADTFIALGDDGIQRSQIVGIRDGAGLGVQFGFVVVFGIGLVGHLSCPSSMRPSTRAV